MALIPSHTMEKQPFEQYDEGPAPPYEENTSTLRSDFSSEEKSVQDPSKSLQGRAAEVRQQHVQLLIDGHITPLLEDAILHGKQSQTIIVVPSDAINANVVLTASNLVHRPKSASTSIIQLQGPNSAGAFWTHSKTIESLERGTHGILRSMIGPPQPTEALPARPAELASPITGQKSWFKRTFGMLGPDHDPTGSTSQWKLGWRSDDVDGRPVKAKEVAFRIETELGLLVTTTVKCVVIDVEWKS